jgi:hypothetical protein
LTRKPFWDTPGDHDADYDREYLINRDSPIRQDIRDLVDYLWEKYEPYCGDPGFLGRAKREFNALTWQMYVAVCLLEAGVAIEKSGAAGPDIKASVAGRRLWIECIAVEAGEGENAATRTYGQESRSGLYRPPPDEKIELRLTTAIWRKTQKRDEWIKGGLIAADDAYVIAVCAGHVPDADLEMLQPHIVKVLYGLDGIAWTFEVGGDGQVETIPTYRDAIERPGKASVTRRGFLDSGQFDGVSAVIMSARCLSSPARAIGRDLVIVHNRVATTPLPLGFLPMGREYWASAVLEMKDYREALPDPEVSGDLKEVVATALREGMKADRVWGRAAIEAGGPVAREGDRALASVLKVHGLLMSVGVVRAVSVLDPADISAACDGFEYFGLAPTAAVLQQAADLAGPDDDQRTKANAELNTAYRQAAPDRTALRAIFREHLHAHPDAYAPVDEPGQEGEA